MWRREMEAEDLEVFERFGGELLTELGYETRSAPTTEG
jgi:hypothetical protein